MKNLKLAAFIVASTFTFNSWAFTIGSDPDTIDVGGLDMIIDSTSLPNSSAADEEAWVEASLSSILGYTVDVTFETKIETGFIWEAVNENPDYWAHALSTDPEYFMIKIGDGNFNGDSHYLFDNTDSLSYAVINLNDFAEGVTLELARISHIAEFNGTVQVPEPGTLALFGMGLIGLASVRRRKA